MMSHFSKHHQPESDSENDAQEDRGRKEKKNTFIQILVEISPVSFPSQNIQMYVADSW